MSKVSFLGAGSWGTALAVMLARHGHNVTLWSAVDSEVKMLKENREHKDRLPGVKLPETVVITDNLEEACTGYDLIVFSVASPYIRETARRAAAYVPEGQHIVNVAKGIEEDSLKTLREIICEEMPGRDVSVLSGPSHAEEVSVGMPTTVVAGSRNEASAAFIQEIFMNDVFRVYISPDVTGIELGGSIKNVIALAAGVSDGLGFGDNTKAALITRGIAEIARLGIAMGARTETFAGLSGIGDLIVTCTSNHSRNHNAGYFIGKGKSVKEAMEEVNQVVEGVYSAKAAFCLAKKYNVSMPIVEQINKVLFEDLPATEAIKNLLTREKCNEYPGMEWK
ncbi:MAG TPA: NAD(P)H-dependent glycerol-3-phosphate dehydrogenase [Lachnospiraceae bacterium]|nr:NAD(P)H-dependent glycerol-3-phosphate dehydrogenase [Lachnospiraceae bacterium]